MALHVYNTLTRRKEEFFPRVAGRVDMFVCGPTVYDLSHVGHAKTYTQFDFVARYLRKLGYDVTYVQSITDVDDKIIDRSRRMGRSPMEVAEEFEGSYLADMTQLGNTSVTRYCRAHDYIPQIVAQIETLIDRRHAYELDDGWYFDLSSFAEYGKLSGRQEVQAEDSVARIDENDKKRQSGDFALWKARKPGEPFWESILGDGRPGWHIEDTAITEAEFGAQYDLHGGAVDLIFPHHEAEIAQMESASGLSPLARYWMHTGLLRVGTEKMSKSKGNIMSIREALKNTDYRTLRYAFLSQHYRSNMELNAIVLENAQNARRRVENFARSLSNEDFGTDSSAAAHMSQNFFNHLDDDFDTPGALAILFEFIRERNRSGEHGGPEALAVLRDINDIFDVFDLTREHRSGDADIDAELERRRALRRARRYDEADEIRAQLHRQGIVIEDTSDGTRWWRT